MLSAAALAFTSVVYLDTMNGGLTPDIEYGVVASKQAVADGNPQDFAVTLANSKVLYTSNETLYGELQVNVSYLFNCHISSNQLLIIDNAAPLNRTVT